MLARVSLNPFTAMFARVSLNPFTAMLARVSLNPFTAMLARVSLNPFTAMFARVSLNPFTAMLARVSLNLFTAMLATLLLRLLRSPTWCWWWLWPGVGLGRSGPPGCAAPSSVVTVSGDSHHATHAAWSDEPSWGQSPGQSPHYTCSMKWWTQLGTVTRAVTTLHMQHKVMNPTGDSHQGSHHTTHAA